MALHRHSNALVDILPPEADSSITLLSQSERPDVTYSVRLAARVQSSERLQMRQQMLEEPAAVCGWTYSYSGKTWTSSCSATQTSALLSSCRLLLPSCRHNSRE